MKNCYLNDFIYGKTFIYGERTVDKKVFAGKTCCVDNKGNRLFVLPNIDMSADKVEKENVAIIENSDWKCALVDMKGNFLTDFVYDNISISEDGLFCVEKDKKIGYIDSKGNEVIPAIYDGCHTFSEGLVAVCQNDDWGMVNFNNATIIPFEYEDLSTCYNNTICAMKNGKWGLINRNNEILVNFRYDYLDNEFSKNSFCYLARIHNKWGLIDNYDNLVEDFVYDFITAISCNNNDNVGEFFSFEKDDKCALYSAKRRMFLTDFIYDNIDFCSENRFRVTVDKKDGFIDINGDVIAPTIYDNFYSMYNEGIVIVKQDGLCGALNLIGQNVIPCEYKSLNNFSEGLALAVNQNYEEGYIDKNNNIIVPFGKFKDCFDFHCGVARVRIDDSEITYIDQKGEC